ncbi:MAG: hypothetical protein JWQ61_3065 [Collimonas fungivorans]|uniref:PqiC family protein n=1 Tax=Collimonas fungivorans TaxID=158899 RepID=UPI0026EFE254|nr:PqiC family protein [Collimonas fungivorans]MDB5768251.1 hypothetical protein [Collimonas fungivorans]
MIPSVKLPMLSAELLLAAAALAGCASPEPRYYTLAPGPAIDAGVAPIPVQSKEPLLIEVPPVRVPERLNRANLLLEDGNGALKVMEQDRWSAPLPDELRDALSQELQASLGAVDIYHQGVSRVAPMYRITVEVVRMDAGLGNRAAAIINWTVQRFPDRKLTSGQTQAELPTSGKVNSVVAAYQQIIVNTAGDIAAAIHTLPPLSQQQRTP